MQIETSERREGGNAELITIFDTGLTAQLSPARGEYSVRDAQLRAAAGVLRRASSWRGAGAHCSSARAAGAPA